MLKKFSLWLSLLAIAVCIFNLSGQDDKNLLLYITSPPLWMTQPFFLLLPRFLSETAIQWISYFVTVFFWFQIGLFIDVIVSAAHRWITGRLLAYSLLASAALVVGGLFFYQYQYSEKVIGHIVRQYEQYNDISVSQALWRMGKQDYGREYVNGIRRIAQTADSKDLHFSAMYALTLIGTPEALRAIVDSYRAPEDTIMAFERNEAQIAAMLQPGQSDDNVAAAIEAARLSSFSSFLPDLERIETAHTNAELRSKAAAAAASIRSNPKVNNPKWSED